VITAPPHIVVLRWPEEDEERRRLRAAGVPRLLLVEPGDVPPDATDALEDWTWAGADALEVHARLHALEVRALGTATTPAPHIDDDGVLRVAGRWVALGPIEARLVAQLIERLGEVVGRRKLEEAGWLGEPPARNTVDAQLVRLRRHLAPLGLALRTVRARGYLLEQVGPGPTAG
jgi:hypothetical protein